jgi:hypothetical protein
MHPNRNNWNLRGLKDRCIKNEDILYYRQLKGAAHSFMRKLLNPHRNASTMYANEAPGDGRSPRWKRLKRISMC